jgi:hypothetical protein
MKIVFVSFICCSCCWFCQLKTEPDKPVQKIASLHIDTINFKTQVQPILEKNCSPCHFPGGKMYEKLPFDKGETIVNHQTVIFKRLKKEEDISLIKQYIQQNKADN